MEVKECIESRRSIRKYRNDTISIEAIKELIDAARKAPSWKNTQVSRYYVVRGEQLHLVYDNLPDFNQKNTLNAQAYIVSTVKNGISGFDHDGNYATLLKDGYQYFDNGLQVENLCLRASDMELGTLIMGLFDEEKIRVSLKIPDDEKIVVIVALGVPETIPEMPRRLPMEEIVKFI